MIKEKVINCPIHKYEMKLIQQRRESKRAHSQPNYPIGEVIPVIVGVFLIQ